MNILIQLMILEIQKQNKHVDEMLQLQFRQLKKFSGKLDEQ